MSITRINRYPRTELLPRMLVGEAELPPLVGVQALNPSGGHHQTCLFRWDAARPLLQHHSAEGDVRDAELQIHLLLLEVAHDEVNRFGVEASGEEQHVLHGPGSSLDGSNIRQQAYK